MAKLGTVQHIPSDLFFELYREGVGVDAFSPHDRLWRAHPDEMLTVLQDLARKPLVSCGPGRESLAMEILFAAPLELTEAALNLIDEVLGGAASPPAALRHLSIWLHTRIERRAPAWRRAYGLLDRLSPAL